MKVYAILESNQPITDPTQYTPLICDTFSDLKNTLIYLNKCGGCSYNKDYFRGFHLLDFTIETDIKDSSWKDKRTMEIRTYLSGQDDDFFAEPLAPTEYDIKKNIIAEINEFSSCNTPTDLYDIKNYFENTKQRYIYEHAQPKQYFGILTSDLSFYYSVLAENLYNEEREKRQQNKNNS